MFEFIVVFKFIHQEFLDFYIETCDELFLLLVELLIGAFEILLELLLQDLNFYSFQPDLFLAIFEVSIEVVNLIFQSCNFLLSFVYLLIESSLLIAGFLLEDIFGLVDFFHFYFQFLHL